jgi:hypothetical protein
MANTEAPALLLPLSLQRDSEQTSTEQFDLIYKGSNVHRMCTEDAKCAPNVHRTSRTERISKERFQ